MDKNSKITNIAAHLTVTDEIVEAAKKSKELKKQKLHNPQVSKEKEYGLPEGFEMLVYGDGK